MTQNQLAIRANITQPYVSDLEKGIVRKKSPTIKVIEDLAEALKICPFLLLSCDRHINCINCKYFKKENFFSKSIRHDVITNIQRPPSFINSYKRWLIVAGKKITLYMEPNLIKDLKKIAVDKDTSVSKILSDLATEYLKKEKENKQ